MLLILVPFINLQKTLFVFHLIIDTATENESPPTFVTLITDSFAYCYARNNVKRWHMIDDFAAPEFFPGKLKMMEKKRPQNFLLTGMLNSLTGTVK